MLPLMMKCSCEKSERVIFNGLFFAFLKTQRIDLDIMCSWFVITSQYVLCSAVHLAGLVQKHLACFQSLHFLSQRWNNSLYKLHESRDDGEPQEGSKIRKSKQVCEKKKKRKKKGPDLYLCVSVHCNFTAIILCKIQFDIIPSNLIGRTWHYPAHHSLLYCNPFPELYALTKKHPLPWQLLLNKSSGQRCDFISLSLEEKSWC